MNSIDTDTAKLKIQRKNNSKNYSKNCTISSRRNVELSVVPELLEFITCPKNI